MNDMMAWMNNYVLTRRWIVITYPYPNFDGHSDRQPSEFCMDKMLHSTQTGVQLLALHISMHSPDRMSLTPLVDLGGKSSHTPVIQSTKFSTKTLYLIIITHINTYNLLNFDDTSKRNLWFFIGNLGIIFTSVSTHHDLPRENGWFGWIKGHPTANGGRDFLLGDWYLCHDLVWSLSVWLVWFGLFHY